MSDLKFNCPVCESTEYDFVRTGMTLRSPILAVSNTGRITWAKTEWDFEDYDEAWYQCAHCDYKLEIDGENIEDEDGLIEWLRSHNCR